MPERAAYLVIVDIDPMPGAWDGQEKIRGSLEAMLLSRVGHYNPVVINEMPLLVEETAEQMKLDADPSDDEIPPVFVKDFDETTSHHWQKDNEANMLFLRWGIAFLNTKLRLQGYLFLNDIYEALGLPKDADGQRYGWTSKNSAHTEIWINDGWENGRITLDFHPEGDILASAFTD